MPTFADQELVRLQAERSAWEAYAATVAELEGRQYEDAEDIAWQTLQLRLAEIRR